MEIVLEMADVDRLIRRSLREEGVSVSEDMRLIVRTNHKKGTIRVVYFKEERPDR